MSEANVEEDRDVSPPEFLKLHCFPLRDFELIKVYEYNVQIIDQLKVIYDSLDKNIEQLLKDQDEYKKAKKRATEFSTRFARNYTYTLQLHLTNLQKFIKSGKAMDRGSSGLLKKMLTNVYYMALQATQAYVSYITPAGRLQTKEKLKSFLLVLKEMNKSCKNILIPVMDSVGHGTEDLMEDVCNTMLVKLMEKLKKPSTKLRAKKSKETVNEKPTLLSMYEGKLGTWKKKVDTIAKLKQGKEKKRMKSVRTARSDCPPSQKIRPEHEKLVTREVISADCDIHTEIQRYELHEAKTKEDLRAFRQAGKTSRIREILIESLNYLDNEDEVTALEKLREITFLEKKKSPTETPSNVQLLCVRSQSMEEINKEIPEEKPDTQMSCRSITRRPTHSNSVREPIVDKSDNKPPIPTPIDILQESILKEDNQKNEKESTSSREPSIIVQKPQSSRRSEREKETSVNKLRPMLKRGITDLTPLTELKIPTDVVDRCTNYKLTRDSTGVQPAAIISRVSDNLVHDLVREVVGELLDDKYLHHIYQYELQAL